MSSFNKAKFYETRDAELAYFLNALNLEENSLAEMNAIDAFHSVWDSASFFRDDNTQALDDLDILDEENEKLTKENSALKDSLTRIKRELLTAIEGKILMDVFSTDGDEWSRNEGWNEALAEIKLFVQMRV